MEADWEIEIADGAPVIDGAWEGFHDLRTDPSRVAEIAEAAKFPALAQALVRLNAEPSPVWTAKCDVWSVEVFDQDEMNADRETAKSALGCYVDLLPSDTQAFSTIDSCVSWCERLCLILRSLPHRQCRLDAIVRRAFLTPGCMGLGITIYFTGCGPTELEAAESLAHALTALADSVLAMSTFSRETSKYNERIVGE